MKSEKKGGNGREKIKKTFTRNSNRNRGRERKNYKTPHISEANRPKVEIGRTDREKEYKEKEKEMEK